MEKKKQVRLSMKLLWKLYADWFNTIAPEADPTVQDFLEYVEKQLRSNK